jgi:thiamine-monophosphate kinase
MVRELSRQLAMSSSAVLLGIGDDAAVLRPARGRLVVSVDVQVEHVHFERAWLSLQQLGQRAVHVAVSDLAAMGARPLASVSSIVAPTSSASRDVKQLARGEALAARDLGCPVVGGNLSAGDSLSISLTVLGEATQPTLRSGARPGDEVWLVGDVGAAAAGLRLLEAGHVRPRASAAKYCVDAWRAPQAAVAQGRRLARVATAMIDLSDGLAGDASQLARASKRRVVLDARALEKALPAPLLEVCRRQHWDPVALALSGGEDYTLLATGAATQKPRGARAIGRVERGRGAHLRHADGSVVALEAGYDHFVSKPS